MRSFRSYFKVCEQRSKEYNRQAMGIRASVNQAITEKIKPRAAAKRAKFLMEKLRTLKKNKFMKSVKRAKQMKHLEVLPEEEKRETAEEAVTEGEKNAIAPNEEGSNIEAVPQQISPKLEPIVLKINYKSICMKQMEENQKLEFERNLLIKEARAQKRKEAVAAFRMNRLRISNQNLCQAMMRKNKELTNAQNKITEMEKNEAELKHFQTEAQRIVPYLANQVQNEKEQTKRTNINLLNKIQSDTQEIEKLKQKIFNLEARNSILQVQAPIQPRAINGSHQLIAPQWPMMAVNPAHQILQGNAIPHPVNQDPVELFANFQAASTSAQLSYPGIPNMANLTNRPAAISTYEAGMNSRQQQAEEPSNEIIKENIANLMQKINGLVDKMTDDQHREILRFIHESRALLHVTVEERGFTPADI